ISRRERRASSRSTASSSRSGMIRTPRSSQGRSSSTRWGTSSRGTGRRRASPGLRGRRRPRLQVQTGRDCRGGRCQGPHGRGEVRGGEASELVDDRDEPVVPERFAQGTDDRRLVAAEPASVVLVEVVLQDVVAEPLDQDLGATGAVGGLGRVARNVPDVDILQPGALGYLVVLLECLDGRQRKVHHLVVGVPSQKVNRHIRAEVVVDPLAESRSRFEVIPDLGHYEVSNLDVNISLVLDLEKGLEDRLRIGNTDVPSDETCLPATLEINGNAVEEILHQRYRLRRIEAV